MHLTKEQHELKRFADFSISGSLVGATSTSRLPGSDIAENNDITSPFESLKTTERDGISPTKSEQQRKIEVHQINVPLPEMGVQDYQVLFLLFFLNFMCAYETWQLARNKISFW